MSLASTAPHNNRVGVLAALHPRRWYWQHLQDERGCWCAVGAADQTCDVGEALFRLSRAPERRRTMECPHCGVVHGGSSA